MHLNLFVWTVGEFVQPEMIVCELLKKVREQAVWPSETAIEHRRLSLMAMSSV